MRTRGRDKSRETEDYQISHWCKRMKTTWRNQEKAKGKMEEKKYLKWYNKVGYGSGDMAGNVVYSFLSSFIMIYLTNIVGLNAGIVGTLIAVSKLFDGVTDIFFGAMIDKTKSRLGKARPWMLYAYIGCAVTLVANFAIPTNMGKFAQYAWFFIAYTLLNAVFFTANNIAYAALVALVTKNSKERVEMGSWRFIFAFSTVLIIQSVTVKFVQILGGGAHAWKVVAIVFAIVGVIVNTISVFSVKELPEEELNGDGVVDDEIEKYGLVEAAKLLFSNKYYIMISVTYIVQQTYSAMLNMGIYYMTYVLLNEDLYAVFSWAINIPLIIALIITPTLVAKWKGLYKLNIVGYAIATVGRALVVAAYMHSVPLMILFTAVSSFGQGPWQGDMGAVVANCSEYTYLTKGKRIDGTMYSCTSFGTKLGGGIGTALTGWLLAASGFNGEVATQSASCLSMLHFMYLWLPVILALVITFIMTKMNVEKANKELRAKRLNG